MHQTIILKFRKFWKTALIVLTIIFIAGVACTRNKHSEIFGVWKGKYDKDSRKGEITLTVNNDMTGVFKYDDGKGNVGSYTVSVVYSDGRYNFIGKEWIGRPSQLNFFELNRGWVFKQKNRYTKQYWYTLRIGNFHFDSVSRTEAQQAALSAQQQAQQNSVIGTVFLIILVIALVVVGITYLITKAMSSNSDKESEELLKYLRSNPHDVRKILGEMRFIAEESFEMYDEYNINKANGSKSLRYGLAHYGRQDELLRAMNHNVKAEWTPRFQFLSEIQNSFNNDKDLWNAFKECRRIDNGIRKLSLFNMNMTNLYESIRKDAKFALKATAVMSIGLVVVGGAIIKNAGKDIGNYPKSRTRYQDTDSGNLYDEDGNRVPF